MEARALSPADAARYLAISKRGLYRLVATGKLVVRKDGGRTVLDYRTAEGTSREASDRC